jgi:phosphonate metabolism protein PhnN/1,5-bisphosphokinase (PRPP-forming)
MSRVLDGSRLIVVVGPSGAGKDSVLRAWRAHLPPGAVQLLRRLVTRPPDPDGEDHENVSLTDWTRWRDAGELAFHWQAHGLAYGVRRSEVERALQAGGWTVLNGSRAHLDRIRAQAPGLRVVEVTASPEVLAARLEGRGREAPAAQRTRIERSVPAIQADLHLRNDGALAEAVDALHAWWLALPR